MGVLLITLYINYTILWLKQGVLLRSILILGIKRTLTLYLFNPMNKFECVRRPRLFPGCEPKDNEVSGKNFDALR